MPDCIEYTKKASLGRSLVSYLVDTEDYEMIGKIGDAHIYVSYEEDYMWVEVLDSANNVGGRIKRIMMLELSYKKRWNSWIVDIVKVDDKYKGIGIAPKIYRYLMKKLGIQLQAGRLQSPGGRSIWHSLFNMKNVCVEAWDLRGNSYELEADDGELYSNECRLYDGRHVIHIFARA